MAALVDPEQVEQTKDRLAWILEFRSEQKVQILPAVFHESLQDELRDGIAGIPRIAQAAEREGVKVDKSLAAVQVVEQPPAAENVPVPPDPLLACRMTAIVARSFAFEPLENLRLQPGLVIEAEEGTVSTE